METIIKIIKVNSFISANHSPVVEELGNGLDGYSFKLSGNISTAGLIKINLSTPYGHTYLIIEVRLKIREY
jgi:hypothetical protein